MQNTIFMVTKIELELEPRTALKYYGDFWSLTNMKLKTELHDYTENLNKETEQQQCKLIIYWTSWPVGSHLKTLWYSGATVLYQ